MTCKLYHNECPGCKQRIVKGIGYCWKCWNWGGGAVWHRALELGDTFDIYGRYVPVPMRRAYHAAYPD